MKFLTINRNEEKILGIKTKTGIIDIDKALSVYPKSEIPRTIMELIVGGQDSLNNIKKYLNEISIEPTFLVGEKEMDWGPAITSPNKIICVGLNYRKHADETNSIYPETPILFPKYNNTLIGHQKKITIPKVTKKLDYEAELGIVMGKTCKYVSEKDALDYVFGYVITNDLSARDLQFKSSQWLLGKSCDHFCPIGPYVVTSDKVINPNNLNVKTIVNGQVKQNSNTSDMIFSCEEIISYISHHMTLTPGDIILTGTPEGVAMGASNEQLYIKEGDIVSVEIESLGKLTNEFVKENE
ncbi:fumarylacetoacetate hydrolase family protein [Ornithinibacillus sp. 4-3]|uniref:Fumarylacetoacetate hydrolase family protein n=1 Tax=Ornithinibacillus sp. 4-3 TaxID=3231488 RepID=A0AB39HLE8_9BACI